MQFTATPPRGHAHGALCASPETVSAFLRHLYGPDAPGWIVITWKFPRSKAMSSQSIPATNLDAAANLIVQRSNAGAEVWLNVGTRKANMGNERGKAPDVEALPGLWVDIDVDHPVHKHDDSKPLAPDLDTALALLAKMPVRPTLIVFTGHGLHAWWLFHRPVSLAEYPFLAGLPKRWVSHQQAIANDAGLHADSVGELARMMRAAGTVNRKNADDPKPIVLHDDTGRRYSPSELADLLDDLDDEPVVVTPKPAPRTTSTDDWQRLASATPSPGDRYDATHNCDDLFVRHGWTLDDDKPGERYYLRPGKKKGEGHGAVVYDDHGPGKRCQVYTDGANIPGGGDSVHQYGPFRLLAHLEYGGDQSAAARALASPTPTTTRALTVTGPVHAAVSVQADDDAGARAEYRRSIRSRLYSLDDLDALPDLTWLVDGWWLTDSLSVMYGKPGCGKSLAALDVACCVAKGIPWHGHATKQAPVLYVAAEGALGNKMRARAWAERAGISRPNADELMMLAKAVNLGHDWAVEDVVDIATEMGAGLVVLDTLARTMGGGDENSSKDMGRFIAACDAVKDATQAHVMVLHHDSRAGGHLRGHSSLDGAADTVVAVRKDRTLVTLTMDGDAGKQKDATPAEDLTLNITPQGDGAVLTDAITGPGYMLSTNERLTLEVLADIGLDKGATATEWQVACEAVKVQRSTWYSHRSRLVRLGLVHDTEGKRGDRYTLTDKGRSRVDTEGPDTSR